MGKGLELLRHIAIRQDTIIDEGRKRNALLEELLRQRAQQVGAGQRSAEMAGGWRRGGHWAWAVVPICSVVPSQRKWAIRVACTLHWSQKLGGTEHLWVKWGVSADRGGRGRRRSKATLRVHRASRRPPPPVPFFPRSVRLVRFADLRMASLVCSHVTGSSRQGQGFAACCRRLWREDVADQHRGCSDTAGEPYCL